MNSDEDTFKAATFHDIYTTYHRKSYLFALSYVKDEFAAEDIVSESLIKLWGELHGDECRNPQQLLLTIIKNKSLNWLKHQRVVREVHSAIEQVHRRDLDIRIGSLEACDPSEIFSTDIQAIIDRTLDQMERQTRQIFVMSRFDHLTNAEIAVRMNLSVKSIEYHINKALKIMRLSLSDYLVTIPLLLWLIS